MTYSVALHDQRSQAGNGCAGQIETKQIAIPLFVVPWAKRIGRVRVNAGRTENEMHEPIGIRQRLSQTGTPCFRFIPIPTANFTFRFRGLPHPVMQENTRTNHNIACKAICLFHDNEFCLDALQQGFPLVQDTRMPYQYSMSSGTSRTPFRRLLATGRSLGTVFVLDRLQARLRSPPALSSVAQRDWQSDLLPASKQASLA
jgi:hypothetical protein